MHLVTCRSAHAFRAGYFYVSNMNMNSLKFTALGNALVMTIGFESKDIEIRVSCAGPGWGMAGAQLCIAHRKGMHAFTSLRKPSEGYIDMLSRDCAYCDIASQRPMWPCGMCRVAC
jgi:hypothetical protein